MSERTPWSIAKVEESPLTTKARIVSKTQYRCRVGESKMLKTNTDSEIGETSVGVVHITGVRMADRERQIHTIDIRTYVE